MDGGIKMTTTMTEKNQVTIPKKITDILELRKGCLFDVQVHRNRIELIPLETREKALTPEQYRKLGLLSQRERGLEKKVTKEYVRRLKNGTNK